MRRYLLVAALSVVLFSCGKSQQTQAPRPAEDRIGIIESTDITTHAVYSASIQGRQDIAILPEIAGRLVELRVHEGEQVKKGQVLFVIDQVPFRAAVETAKANVQAAEAGVSAAELVYKSRKQLYADSIISEYDMLLTKNEWLSAKAGLAQAKAALVIAENNLNYTEVKSPSNGVVGTLPLRVGAMVSPQMPQPLTTVSDNSTMYVYFSMTEAQMMSLSRRYGSPAQALQQMPNVSLRLCDGTMYDHAGRVETFSGVIDRQTGAVSVRAVFPNPERLLLSGGSCDIVLPVENRGVIVIPQEATYEIQDKIFVFRVMDGKAVSTMVNVTPVEDGKRYIVTDGLQAGERIILRGAGLVRDGEEVE